jgi:Amt family ammonium transporter
MHLIPGLGFHVPEATETSGIDESDMGEYAYDYVGLELELKPQIYVRSTSTAYGSGQDSEPKEPSSAYNTDTRS